MGEKKSEQAFFKALKKLKSMGDSPVAKRLLASLVERLFEKFYADIEKVLRSKISPEDYQIVDDLCQQSFLTIHEELVNFRGKSWPQIKLYLIRTAINRYKRYKKTQKRLPSLFPIKMERANQKISISEEEAREKERVLETLLEIVTGKNTVLGEPYREVLRLRFWESRSHKEISQFITNREKKIPLGPFEKEIFAHLNREELPEILVRKINEKQISISQKDKVRVIERDLQWKIIWKKATYLLQRQDNGLSICKKFTRSNSKISLHRALIQIWQYFQKAFPGAPWEKF